MDVIREIEAFVLKQWLDTGRTPTIDDLITIFQITEDVFTKSELETILIEHEDDDPTLALLSEDTPAGDNGEDGE